MAKTSTTTPDPAEPSPQEERAERLRRALFWPLFLLLALAVTANVMLQDLYMQVLRLGPGGVQSFCAINERLNCVTVAASAYSSIWGIPVSLLGLEFFGLLTSVVLLSKLGILRLRRWDSLLFIGLLMALPVSIMMAVIAVVWVKSVCIMCSLIYGTNVVGLLILLGAYRRQLGDLLRAGPRELLGERASALTLVVVVVLGLSQLLWVPKLLGTPKAAPTGKQAIALLAGVPSEGTRLGLAQAPFAIDEFTDFECPHCSRAHDVLLKLVKRFPRQVRVRHFDYPLDSSCNRKIRGAFHERACLAAFYARCAGDQGKYWPFAATIFHNQRALTEDDLERYGRELGLDVDKLKVCASRTTTRQAVLTDIEEGIRRGIEGTPTFFINGKEKVLGPRPIEWWEKKITATLQGKR